MIGLAPTLGLLVCLFTMTTVLYFLRGESRLSFGDHFWTFIIVGALLFVPWSWAYAGIIDATLTNEEKFVGDCAESEEQIGLGNNSVVVGGEDVNEDDMCNMSSDIAFGWLLSGFVAYLWCWRGAVAFDRLS